MSNVFEIIPLGIITFSSDWKIDFVNSNFIKYGIMYSLNTNISSGEDILETEIFSDLNLKDDLESLKEGYSFEKEIKSLKTLDNKFITLQIKGSPIFEQEKFNGGILIIEDIKTSPVKDLEPEISSDHFEQIFSRGEDFLAITDSSGSLKYSIGKNAKLLKIPPFGFTKNHITKFFDLDIQEELNNSISAIIDSNIPQRKRFQIRIDEAELIFDCRIEPILNKNNAIQFILFFFYDITEILAERQLLEKKIEEFKQLAIITESIKDAIFAIDENGNIIYWNKSSELLFGYSKSEVFGKNFEKVLGIFEDSFFNSLKSELAVTKFKKVTINVFMKNGEKEIIDTKFSISDENQSSVIVLCSNETQRTQFEQKLIASEEKFRNIVTQASEIICSLTPAGEIIYANPAFHDLFEVKSESLKGMNIKEFIDPEFLTTNSFDVAKLAQRKVKNYELHVLTYFDKKIVLQAGLSPVLNENNSIKYINAIFTDITRKKTALNELNIFRSAFKASQDGIIVLFDNRIIVSNTSFCNIFGYYSEQELNDRNLTDFILENDRLKVEKYLEQVSSDQDAPSRFEFMAKRKDGIRFYAEASAAAFDVDGKKHILLGTRDITERKRTQQAIRKSEEKYRNIAENIDDFLFTYETMNNALKPVFYTSSVEKITGYNQAELLSDSRLVLKMVYPDDLQEVMRKLKGLFKSKIQVSGEFEFRIINKHGNIVWIRAKINLIKDTQNKIQKIYGLVSDITLRKKVQDELTKSTEDLVKLNETKDRFISIISHDLRTPFSSILGFTDLLLGDSDLSQKEQRQYVEFIQEASRSMLSLVNSLLDWTRLQTGRIRFEPQRVSAPEIIENSINAMSGVAYQKVIKLISKVEKDVFVFVDRELILQVFNNLISNAIKFTNNNGSITISVHRSPRTRFLEFSVQDTGIGIKKENLDKLFKIDSKYTSEGTAGERGSGLGLSLVHEIIEKHGGSIRVESEYGEGSNFIFTLPIASANILLVDDSKTDRLLYSKILKNITPDYNVEIASDGQEALDKILESPPALVITDHIMPRMTGIELILELKKADINAKPPIIILSSDLDRNTIIEYSELGVENVFQKPVNLASFKTAVEKELRKGLLGQ